MAIHGTIARAKHFVDIEKAEQSYDAANARVISYVKVKFNVACWVQPAKAADVSRFSTLGTVIDTVIYFGVDPEVVRLDRLIFGEITLSVESCINVAGLNRLWTVYARGGI